MTENRTGFDLVSFQSELGAAAAALQEFAQGPARLAAEEVSVLDATSGDDLTERTLTYALLADDARRDPLVPSALLRALLRYRKGPRKSDFTRHLSRAVASFQKRR